MKSGGFGLVEILVALWLGALLLGGLVRVYLNVRASVNVQRSLGALQTEARFITQLLRHRIRMAGNAACEKEALVHQKLAIMGGHVGALDQLIIGACLYYRRHLQFIRMAYFVDDTHRKNNHGESIFALYQKPDKGPREELSAGVSQLKVCYGVFSKTKRGITRCLPASQITDWLAVRSVSVSFQLTTPEGILHKPWHFYVALRERT